jgi:class 3 adenylate cyclase
VKHYIPPNVLHYHDASQAQFLNSNRRVSILFVSLPPATTLTFEKAQAALLAIQKATAKFSGLLRQFIVDDKSTVAICCWGAPPQARHNDAARCVAAAAEMSRSLKSKVDGPVHFGVSHGMCFLGCVGNGRRCEYVMVGAAVNKVRGPQDTLLL